MSAEQYLRKCTLVVADAKGTGFDLSNLRIKFTVKKTDVQTPNTAEIRVFNLADETANQIKKEFTTVTLQAGYENNFGVIFQGNIKRTMIGRENGVDTFIDIEAGDGDSAYNYAIVNTTLKAGSTQAAQLKAAAEAMTSKGVTVGFIDDMGQQQLPRGKVMYGASRNYLRDSSSTAQANWSIQNGKIQVIKLTSVLPNQAVLLNSQTGLVGIPTQTEQGIKARCLLNPMIRVGGKVKINEGDIQKQATKNVNVPSKNDPKEKKLADITADGFYRVLVCEYSGDTRANDWYSDLTCLSINSSVAPSKSVKKNG